MKNCLLLGRNAPKVENVKVRIAISNINLVSGTSLQDVKDTFSQHRIDIVIMGAGINLNDRLNIVRYIFETSNITTVHMKDWDSGPEGFLPFVNDVLTGLIRN